MGKPTLTVNHPICALGLRSMPPTKTFIRTEIDDPLSAALLAPGAKMVPSRDFRATGAGGQLGRPLAPTDSLAWDLENRLVQADGKHVWIMGVRLGSQASGPGTN